MKLIVGLGNPGKEYEGTRHNCGFMVVDELANKLNTEINQNKFKGLYTYMNLSGESVIAAMNFFKLDKEDIIVIYDDLDMPVGKLRLRKTGSAGGHNGIKNIIAHLSSQDFKRIRVGIDRHKYMKVVDYVLSRFAKEETEAINQGIDKASDAVLDYLDHDFDYIMNRYN